MLDEVIVLADMLVHGANPGFGQPDEVLAAWSVRTTQENNTEYVMVLVLETVVKLSRPSHDATKQTRAKRQQFLSV
jgi:hypothetical protein